MELILTVMVPVFGLIAIGYLTMRLGIVPDNADEVMGDFIFTIGVPILLALTMFRADFGGASPFILWGTYFIGAFATWAMAHLLVRWLYGRDARSGVIAGVSAAFSNTILIGIPLTQQVYGEEGLAIALLLISVHLALMMLVSTILIDRAAVADGIADQPASWPLGRTSPLPGLVFPLSVGEQRHSTLAPERLLPNCILNLWMPPRTWPWPCSWHPAGSIAATRQRTLRAHC